jgi:hypothetical protein
VSFPEDEHLFNVVFGYNLWGALNCPGELRNFKQAG